MTGTASRRDPRALVLGLGGCVDVEIDWNPVVLEELAGTHGIRHRDLARDEPIVDERSLVCSILAFLRDGAGGERFARSSEVLRTFADQFSTRTTLGGTPVRAAIAAARLGVPSTVHLVSIDDTVRRLLPPAVRYLSSAAEDGCDPHLIVQYPQGTAIQISDGAVVAPRPNRVIYVHDPANWNLALSPQLPSALRGARALLVSGFNAMTDPSRMRSRIQFLRSAMTQLPETALVYYEDAAFHHPEARRVVSEELPGRIDIHSLNEDELQSYLGREVDLLDAAAVAAALSDHRRFAVAPTLVVHTSNWALAFGQAARRYRDALDGGIAAAGARYVCGDNVTAQDVDAIGRLGRQPSASRFADELNQLIPHRVCCVPACRLETSSPTTVGLGDAFVGGFLAKLGTVSTPAARRSRQAPS